MTRQTTPNFSGIESSPTPEKPAVTAGEAWQSRDSGGMGCFTSVAMTAAFPVDSSALNSATDGWQFAQTIVAHHEAFALEPNASAHLFMLRNAAPVCKPSYAQAVHAACLALNFDPKDAQCLSDAWARQSQRSGRWDATCWPTELADFVEHPSETPTPFAPCPKHLGLYAVLPDAIWVKRMAVAGVPTVQLRFKSDDASAIAREVEAAVRAVEGTSALLFINDHWQAAMNAGAYGVHLGQEDMFDANLSQIRSAGLRLGLSSHGYAEMLLAHQQQPSYIAMGAVYATTLKRMTTPPQGIARLKHYAALLKDTPTVAIGGIDEARLPDVLQCGVGSVAVVRALVASLDPEAVAKSWSRTIAQTLQPHSSHSHTWL